MLAPHPGGEHAVRHARRELLVLDDEGSLRLLVHGDVVHGVDRLHLLAEVYSPVNAPAVVAEARRRGLRVDPKERE